jgi:hypothetical protein
LSGRCFNHPILEAVVTTLESTTHVTSQSTTRVVLLGCIDPLHGHGSAFMGVGGLAKTVITIFNAHFFSKNTIAIVNGLVLKCHLLSIKSYYYTSFVYAAKIVL